MKYYIRYLLYLAFITATSCKKPYNPVVTSAPNSYLVVEGVINSGADSTFIKLSRTVNIADKITLNPLANAIVTVESDQNNTFPLREISIGTYASGSLNLDNTRKYRLRIKTANGEYLSDLVAVLNSPPIDSINYTVESNGINIFATTHDPKNSTRYYRWDYQETYIFHSNYPSAWKSNGDTVLIRNTADQIYYCWRGDTSSTIILGSSAKLKQDVIFQNPITSISSTSEKLTKKYSILLRQYALTSEAYTFWQNLKKNTEQLGSIFDALPTNINGNMHSTTNASEPVIGYVSVGSVATKRIFISSDKLPTNFIPANLYPSCELDSFLFVYYPPGVGHAPINQENLYFNINKGATYPLIPVNAITTPMGTVLGHTGANAECVDCTLRGTNKQPSFWQ